MSHSTNAYGQPIGASLAGWAPPPLPPPETLEGRLCRLEPLSADRHTTQLFAANSLDTDGQAWTYLPYGPFPDFGSYHEWMVNVAAGVDPQFYAIIHRESGQAVGVASYLRIQPAIGSIEVGHIHYSQSLRRTPAATEAMYLLMRRAFDLGYRRYEWKCDSLNAPSRAAALRLGFTFEGIHRQATVYKGRSRDTAWYSVIDAEWPRLRTAFERWLDPTNFDGEGRQLRSLGGR
ncbi:MAG: GCN5-related N-acetyltransferase [Armatimonadetes bacterium]|jgi:RimJ/RimL family protein N-acetyltransferase|nr:GCN5-related N-acetyltransferase [Armatimonadota bacterium]